MSYTEHINKSLSLIVKSNKGYNNLSEPCLFELRTIKPNHTDKINYVNLGPLLGKKYFNRFLEVVKKEMNIKIDSAMYSRICVEVSEIDENPYIEISLNKVCHLPIAGSQYHILSTHANNHEMCLEGYVDSLNFILNDIRNFND